MARRLIPFHGIATLAAEMPATHRTITTFTTPPAVLLLHVSFIRLPLLLSAALHEDQMGERETQNR